jgi:hypothetical protein
VYPVIADTKASLRQERFLLLQFRGLFAHGITVNACTNITVANLTMHNVGMFFVVDWAGHGNQVCLSSGSYC